MANEYKIVSVQPWTYIDNTNRLIEGYRVWFNIAGYDETYSVLVNTMDAEVIRKTVLEFVAKRKAIG